MKKTQYIISGAGIAAALVLFARWWADTPGMGAAARACALLSAGMMVALCLRFVPVWLRFWAREGGAPEDTAPEGEGRGDCARLFLALLLADAAVLLLVFLIRRMSGHEESFAQSLQFWTCADSRHYLDIARDWYLSEGEWDRLVQLVFLPGYPLAVRAAEAIVGDFLCAGLLVSALSFAGAGCVLYLLLRLDHGRAGALRGVKYLCLLPGSFFFAAPMSDALFLLLSLGCVYLARRGRWLFSCLLGALAAFTRSLGLVLLLPVLFELVRDTLRGPLTPRRVSRFALLPLIPAGFAGYCLINYLVAGDPFQYMEYQSVHWGQRLGLFFNTAAYQLENALKSFRGDVHVFLGLWLPNLLCSFGALGVMLAGARRLRASYTAYFIGYFFVAIGATWLLSAPRYLASLFPLAAALSCIGEDRRADTALSLLLAGCWAAYLCAFALRWQVW